MPGDIISHDVKGELVMLGFAGIFSVPTVLYQAHALLQVILIELLNVSHSKILRIVFISFITTAR